MNKKTIFIILITIINLIAIIIIKPIVASFYGELLIWKFIYIAVIYGFPLWIIIPLALLVAPFAWLFKRSSGFKSVWSNYTQHVFLVFAIILLLLNTLLIYTKYSIGLDSFQLKKYSEINGYTGNTEDLKQGRFEYEHATIIRYKDKQIEHHKNYSSEYSIKWLTNNEYRLINLGDNRGMIDTLDVKITNNTNEFYECYVKYDIYAGYFKILKK